MPPVLLKDVLVEIRHSLGRFFSILLIVALGVAFFAGIKASAPDMKASADAYFDTYNLQDIQVFSTLGLTKEDLEEIEKLPGVKAAQGLFTLDVLTYVGNSELVYKIFSLPEDNVMNDLRVTEGRLPVAANECFIEDAGMETNLKGSFEIGDVIKIYSGNDDSLRDSLEYEEYTVVGKGYTPRYLSYEMGTSSIGSGSVDGFMFVPESDVKADYYTEVDVTVVGAREINSYDDEYFDVVSPVVSEIEKIADARIAVRIQEEQDVLDRARRDMEKQIADAREQLAKARREVSDGEAEITENESSLVSARSELDAGWQEYNAGMDQVNENLPVVEAGIAQVESAISGLDALQSNKVQIEDGLAAAEAGKAQAQAAIDEITAQVPDVDGALEQIEPHVEAARAGIEQAEKGLEQLNGQIEQVELVLADPALDAASRAYYEAMLVSLRSQVEIVEGQKAAAEEVIVKYEQLLAAKEGLVSAREGLERAQATIDDLNEKLSAVNGGIAQIEAAREKLPSLLAAKSQLESAREQLASAYSTLVSGEAEYADGLAQIAQARQKIADALAEIEENETKLEKEEQDALAEIEEGQEKINDLDGEWIVLDRDSFYSYRDYESCAERMDGIASVFPVFFFLVAALVCMTTMSRMVEEQRTEIGTLKALGYSKVQISMKYLLYALSASVLGSVLGCGLGMVIFPYIIFYAWNTMYTLSDIVYLWQWWLMFYASASVTGVTLLATVFSIWRELMEQPSQLMRPVAGKAGKKILLEHIPAFWNRVPFLHKVTIRNIFRYKKRFFMTVIGISGCSALLVAGFGINDSISNIVPSQYGEIYHYNAEVKGDGEDIAVRLSELSGVDGVFEEVQLPVTLNIDGKDISGTVHVIEDGVADEFGSFTSLLSVADGELLELPEDGVLVSQKMAEKMNLSSGSSFSFTDADDEEVSAVVEGVFEQYVGHQIYVRRSVFDSWDLSPEGVVAYLVTTDDQSAAFEEKLGNQIMGVDGVTSVSFYSRLAQNFLDMIGSIKMVVVVLVMCAAMLAFVVLYNLSNVNISERLREIATIKVLGFTEKEVNAYVNRESIILAVIGSLVGLVLGIYLHHLIMNLAELDDVMFGRTINGSSFVISFVMTVFFAGVVNFVMKFKLRKIQMVESLKAVE